MLLGLTLAGVVYSLIVLAHCDRSLRTALGAYLGIYFVTSVVGGLILRYPGPLAEALNIYLEATGADLKLDEAVRSPSYAVGLASPFFVVPTIAWALFKIRWMPDAYVIAEERNRNALLLAFVLALATQLGWCAIVLYRSALIGQIFELEAIWSGYGELLSARELAFAKLGAAFFGVVYVGLPALSFIALAAWIDTRSLVWGLGLGIAVLSCALLVIGTGQKAPLLAHWLILGLAYYMYGRTRSLLVPLLVVAILFLALTAFQILTLETWEMLDTLLHLLLRMGFAVPYYFYVFPALEPFTGIDLLHDVTGLGETHYMQIPLTVFSQAFPSVPNMTGFAPAAAHVSAYAEGGFAYLFVVEALVALWIVVVSSLILRARSWIGRGAALTGLLSVYYLTQASIRLTIIGGFGVIWGVASLLSVAFTYLLLDQLWQPSSKVATR